MYSAIIRNIPFSVFIMVQTMVSAQLVKDSSFGYRGMQFIAMPTGAVSTAISFKPLKDGRVVSFITSYSGGIHSLYLHRTKSNGQPDSSFGINGFQPLGIYGQWIEKSGFELDDSGYCYVWGSVSTWNGNSGSGTTWLRRYDSFGIHDTAYNPLELLKGSRLSYFGQDYFTIGKSGLGYLAMAYYNDNVLIRLTRAGKLDSGWSKDGIADSVLYRIKGLTENSSGQVSVFGLLDASYQCAKMTLSPTGTKDLIRSMKGWITSTCGSYTSPEAGVKGIVGLEYNSGKRTLEFAVTLLRSMYEVVPTFGKAGRAIVPGDSAMQLEAADLLKNPDGSYLLFWRRFNYQERFDDKLIPEDFWSGATLIDAKGNVISGFGNKGKSYLLDNGRDYYAVKKAELLPDGSIIALMNIWNGGAYGAVLVKYKPLLALNYTLSRPKIMNNKTVQVFPNPAENFIQLSGFGLSSYFITDLSGRVVKSGILNQSNDFQRIELDLNRGSYILNIQLQSGEHHSEFVNID
jgi:hypothetical protein